MELVLLLIRLGLYFIFSIAAIGKLLDREGSAEAARGFGVPEPLVPAAVVLLPVIEIATAFGLIYAASAWYAALLAAAMLIVFIIGMIMQMMSGRAASCHCFGQLHSGVVGKASILRNVIFLAAAAVLLIAGFRVQGLAVGSDLFELLAATLLLTLVSIATAVLISAKGILSGQRDLAKRLNVIEALSRDSSETIRDEAGSPHDALPIGAPLPSFELTDAAGRILTADTLLLRGKPLLFIFVGPNCGPCSQLRPYLENWKEQLRQKVELVLVSTGTVNENREKFGDLLLGSMTFQPKKEFSEKVRAKWTPTALFIRRDGIIASRPAVGDAAIKELVDTLLTTNIDADNFYFISANGRGHGPEIRIGQSLSAFEKTALNGELVDNGSLVGRQTLILFMSLTCSHCVSMVADVRRIENEKNKHAPQIIIFSDGDPDLHREWQLTSPIVLDEGYKISQKLGMSGTPSAVMIAADGTIVSETAIGTENIRALLGEIS